MKSCCVVGCDINSNNDVIYFEFPTSRTLRRKWLDAIQITGKLTMDSAICSDHFPQTDYEIVRGKVRLKRKVVPSIFHRDEVKKYKGNDKNIDIDTDKHSDIFSENKIAPVENTIASQTENPLVRVETEESQKPNSELDRQSKINGSTNDISVNKPECHTDVNNEGRTGNKHLGTSQKKYFKPEGIITKECIRPNVILDPDPRQDIEEMITNYQIKNKPNKLATPAPHVPDAVEAVHEPRVVEAEPVFIEVSVGKDGRTSEVSAGNRDCLMVLESVQVDVDPSSLMLPEREEDSEDEDNDDVIEVTKKEDPISLLTSSDDDEVIIEEPNIDTVEVSDEDEDDIPLAKLSASGDSKKYDDIAKIMYYEYYCIECKYNTSSKSDYNKHLKLHGTVLQMCQICGYTTSSKGQFTRHKRRHKDEKRYKCHLCNFKAKHQMSLIYHLKSHEGQRKRFACALCRYETMRRSDLKRHQQRLHNMHKDLESYSR